MTLNQEDFKNQALQFLSELFPLINASGVKIEKHWNIDHLCFRAATDEAYIHFKNQFSKFSTLLIESEVNGRLISTFKLAEPLNYLDWSIGLVELPAPKKGKVTIQGFEHIEVVVDIPLAEIKKMYPASQFDEGGLKKFFNQELEIMFGKLALKFHPLSLESVINVEKNSKLFKALYDSGVLLNLKSFGALVTGTFPLDIAIDHSDIDIVVSTDQLLDLADLLKGLYGGQNGFKLEVNSSYIVSEFSFSGFKFEIYAEKTLSCLQDANLHFLIEERLLKLGSEKFKKKIIELKKAGLKTEPAFAQVLNLNGDPYQALINIRKKSESELKALLAGNSI